MAARAKKDDVESTDEAEVPETESPDQSEAVEQQSTALEASVGAGREGDVPQHLGEPVVLSCDNHSDRPSVASVKLRWMARAQNFCSACVPAHYKPHL